MSRQFWTETLAWATADGTAVTNTTTETIVFPNITIPANYLQDGRTLRIVAWGRISNVVTSAPTYTWRLRWGGVAGTILCQSAAITASTTAVTSGIWKIEIMLTIRTNGSSGSVYAIGELFQGNQAGETAANVRASFNGMGSAGATVPAAVTVDLTADTALSLTIAMSAANASNSVQGHNYYLESLN